MAVTFGPAIHLRACWNWIKTSEEVKPTWQMKPVDEHCRTQRLNFLFFLLRSSLSVHVAMKTGSSSIRGSCSTCKWQENRRGRETEEYVIAEKNGALNSSKEIQTLHCACVHYLIQRSKPTFVQCYHPTKTKNQSLATLHCGWLLHTCFANIARHGSHFSLSATV